MSDVASGDKCSTLRLHLCHDGGWEVSPMINMGRTGALPHDSASPSVQLTPAPPAPWLACRCCLAGVPRPLSPPHGIMIGDGCWRHHCHRTARRHGPAGPAGPCGAMGCGRELASSREREGLGARARQRGVPSMWATYATGHPVWCSPAVAVGTWQPTYLGRERRQSYGWRQAAETGVKHERLQERHWWRDDDPIGCSS